MRSSRNVWGKVFLLSTTIWALSGCGGGANPSTSSGPPLSGGVTLLDDQGNALSGTLTAGSDLNIALTGLEPNRSVEVLLNGPGEAMRLPSGEQVQGYFRVSTDKDGGLPRISLLEQPATGDYQITVRYTGASGGTVVPLQVAPVTGRADLRVGSVSGDVFSPSRLVRVGESLAVRGSGLPSGIVDIYIVSHDPTGNLGPTLADISGFVPDDSLPSQRGLTGTAETVQVGSDGLLPTTELWRDIEPQALGQEFDLVIDTNRDGTYDPDSDIRHSTSRSSFQVIEADSRDGGGSDKDLVTDGNSAQTLFQINGKVWSSNCVAPLPSEPVIVGAYVVKLSDLATNGVPLVDVSGPSGSAQPEMRLRGRSDQFGFSKMPIYPPDLRSGDYGVVIDLNGNGILDRTVDYVDGLDGNPAVAVSGIPTQQKWTVMVYVDADNDLEGALLNDLDEMEAPTYIRQDGASEVAVCAQFDRIPGNDTSNGDWTTTRRFVMATDHTPGVIGTQAIEDLGEQDMGNPETLRSFINWAKATAPADHYMLIINSHGNGPKSRGASSGLITRGVGFDYTSGYSMLTPAELSDVIRGTGGVDVLGFDACQMGSVEVLAQLVGCADYVVASELLFPGTSYAYDKLLKNLVANADMSSRDLALEIVETNREQYANTETVALSAFDMAAVPDLVSSINALCIYLLNDPAGDSLPVLYGDDGAWPNLLLGRKTGKIPGLLDFEAEPHKSESDDLRDFDVLMDAIIADSNTPFLRDLAEAAKVSRQEATMSSLISAKRESSHHGLSIWLPDLAEYNDHKSAYRQLTMSRQTLWDDLIEKIHQAKYVIEINGATTTGPYSGFRAYTVTEEVALGSEMMLDGSNDGTFVGKGQFIVVTDKASDERRAMVLQLVYPSDWESPPRWRITTSGVSMVIWKPTWQMESTMSTSGWTDREMIDWNFWLPYWIGPNQQFERLDKRKFYGL